MRIFISGGCKNGKSTLAQRLAQLQSRVRPGRLYYVATMRPVDHEDERRILRHREERSGWGFETVEIHTGLADLKNRCEPNSSLLLDSLTAWLMNEMFPPGPEPDFDAHLRMETDLRELLDYFGDIVVVSDYIFSDAALYGGAVESYQRALAHLDRAAASVCDAVLEVIFGGITAHRGGMEFRELYEKNN